MNSLSPPELASHLLDRLGIQGKPDLYHVAERIGLRIQEVDSEGFEGTLVRALDGPKGIVAVKRSIREDSRKRFTIAHEIGHYLIPSHRTLENVCVSEAVESWGKGLDSPELGANDFAVELLLPARFVRDSLRVNDPSFRTISAIANQYETSLTATTLRFVDLTDLPCVVVFSTKKRDRWYRRSPSFPFYLSKEFLPCEGSFAHRLFESGNVPNDFAEVSPESWLDRRDAEKISRLFEHSVHLPYYDSVLTLLWFYVKDAVYEEESALEDLDPEEFTLRRKHWPR